MDGFLSQLLIIAVIALAGLVFKAISTAVIHKMDAPTAKSEPDSDETKKPDSESVHERRRVILRNPANNAVDNGREENESGNSNNN